MGKSELDGGTPCPLGSLGPSGEPGGQGGAEGPLPTQGGAETFPGELGCGPSSGPSAQPCPPSDQVGVCLLPTPGRTHPRKVHCSPARGPSRDPWDAGPGSPFLQLWAGPALPSCPITQPVHPHCSPFAHASAPTLLSPRPPRPGHSQPSRGSPELAPSLPRCHHCLHSTLLGPAVSQVPWICPASPRALQAFSLPRGSMHPFMHPLIHTCGLAPMCGAPQARCHGGDYWGAFSSG